MEERDTASSYDRKAHPQNGRFKWRLFETARFLEALAVQVAINAVRNFGRLAAGPALCNLFQVYSTWSLLSVSNELWKNLTRVVWNRKHLLRDTYWNWRKEYIYHHRIAHNFYVNNYILTSIPISLPKYNAIPRIPPPELNYAIPPILPPENNDWDNNSLICLRLALSDQYFATGFSNGTVELYLKSSKERLGIFYHKQRVRVGGFSSAVTGIILSEHYLVFSSLDGDIRVVVLNPFNPHLAPPSGRVAHCGDIMKDGCLVDFGGCGNWWVGLYAGVHGRAFHVWNSETEQITFEGGTLTDPEVIPGRLLLAHISNSVGRIKVSSHGIATACTTRRAIKFNLRNPDVTLATVEYPNPDQAIMLRCFDATEDLLLLVNGSGWASVRRELNDEVVKFRVRDDGVVNELVGCMNNGYAMIHESTGGAISIWDDNGRFLNRLKERLNHVTALVTDGTYLLASTSTTLWIWDFGHI